jgi:LysM repeat protein
MTDRSVPTGRSADDDITSEFWGDAPTWRPSGQVSRIGRRRGRSAPAGTRSHRVIGPDTQRPSERSEPSPAPPSWADLDHALDLELDLELDLDLDRRIDLGDLPDRRPADRRIAGTVPGRIPGQSAARVADGGAPATSSASQQLAERLGVGSVDPLLLRLGTLVLIGILMVPLALMVRATPEDEVRMGSNLVAATASRLPAGRDTARSTVPVPDSRPAADVVADDAADDVVAGQSAQAAAPVCALSYTVGAGDYWLRIAEESGLDLATVLTANGATTDTAIHPGDQVCLPAGATMPSPPPAPTTVPPTTAPPATSASATASSGSSGSGSGSSGSGSSGSTARPASATAAAPAATAPAPPTTAPASPPPTTAPKAKASAESPEQVVALIREIWPDDLEERAITIARRESSLRPGADNGHCCYGVFQIYWSSHRNWLANHGVTSSAQLLDARTNIKLAYEIYRRAGGWGPWSQTAY